MQGELNNVFVERVAVGMQHVAALAAPINPRTKQREVRNRWKARFLFVGLWQKLETHVFLWLPNPEDTLCATQRLDLNCWFWSVRNCYLISKRQGHAGSKFVLGGYRIAREAAWCSCGVGGWRGSWAVEITRTP